MLASLSILAVVGGALAFTAKDSAQFCTALPDHGSCDITCPDLGKVKATSDPNVFICTSETNGNPKDPCSKVVCTEKVNAALE